MIMCPRNETNQITPMHLLPRLLSLKIQLRLHRLPRPLRCHRKFSSSCTCYRTTVTENSASVSNEQNATKSIPEEDVRNLVNKWQASWQSGDMETYRGCYAADFKAKGMNLNTWISYKTKVHQKNKNISIRIEDLKISADAKDFRCNSNLYSILQFLDT